MSKTNLAVLLTLLIFFHGLAGAWEKQKHKDKTAPKQIDGKEGDSNKPFYFSHVSDVEVTSQTRYYHSIENLSKSKLLTVEWNAVDLFGDRISPDGCIENIYPGSKKHDTTSSDIRFGETLTQRKPGVRCYVEVQEDEKNETKELKSEISLNADMGKVEFDFLFSSRIDDKTKTIQHAVVLRGGGGSRDFAFAIPELNGALKDADSGWKVVDGDIKLGKHSAEVVFSVEAKVPSIARVRTGEAQVRTVKVLLFQLNHERKPFRVIATGRVAAFVTPTE